MDEVQERYAELMVSKDQAVQARKLNPLYERELFGKHIFLYDSVDREQLSMLGELHTPNVADLFVAKMKGDTKP
jgi:ABC-2 type transport system ATP-binding protein